MPPIWLDTEKQMMGSYGLKKTKHVSDSEYYDKNAKFGPKSHEWNFLYGVKRR